MASGGLFVFLTLLAAAGCSPPGLARPDPQEDAFVRLECNKRCHLQNNETVNHGELVCDADCVVNQCIRGCGLWNEALTSNCSKVCDNFNANYISTSKLYCIAGCDDAITLYFQKIQSEIGSLSAPSLVPDSLTDKSLRLHWKGDRRKNLKYKVQWKLENSPSSNWQYCQKETWINDYIIQLDNLRPYTNYQFRVVLLLTWSGVMQLIVSESSVVISTYSSKVPPSVTPEIVRTISADSSISVTWNAIPFPLAPILSYHLTIQEPTKGYTVFKEILTGKENLTENFYTFRNLESEQNYSISLAARNEYGLGPISKKIIQTLPSSTIQLAPEPINLFLVSSHNIFIKTTELVDSPIAVYDTDKTINGVSLNIHKNIIYVTDSSGSLLSFINNKINTLLTVEKEVLMDTTIDWLNNYLYILISSMPNKNTKVYSVKRFDLERKKLIEIVSGFDEKPFQIGVDPYNGFLFWTTKFGLYRMDLSKKIYNLKMEMSSLLIVHNRDIGPFVIDYLNFCLFVLFQKSNTVMSVSLDGQEIIDIRNNTETALFDGAVSLTCVNGSFYWSNGSVLIGEEYSVNAKKYFQHIHPDDNYSYNLILSNFTDQQPIPLPRNPPQSLQAISTHNKLKASWHVPQLLGGQGRSSWQGWSYRFSISTENETIWKNIDVNETEIVIDSLTPNTNYVIRVAAFSFSGQGPWSSEFLVKTLNHNVTILWGNAQQILISDVMGDYVESITLNNEKTNRNSSLNDITWYEDCIYYVVNSSKIYWLNITSRLGGTLEGINNVQSISIDWLGQKIYWADPLKQSILRENLFGGQRELLIASNIAKELKVESVGGYLYWSTGFSVNVAKLNGKEQQSYYSTDYFSGKKVMSLAVDSVGHWVYWILRDNEKSKLFRAPTAEMVQDFPPRHIKEFDNLYAQGPLFYVDRHLLWLHYDNDIIISDTNGQYPAIVRTMNLNGIHTFSVRDPYTHPKPKGIETNVIPEEVNIKMIKVNPRHNEGVYEITWDPVKNVNHGIVSYTVKVIEKEDSKVDSLFDTPNTRILVYSTPIEISIKASTVWGSSQTVTLYSPIPSTPTDIRIFGNSSHNQTIDVVLQHSSIENITRYEIMCFYQLTKNNWKMCSNQTIVVSTFTHTVWPRLAINTDYLFKIRACSTAGCGAWSPNVILNKTTSIFTSKTALVCDSKITIFYANKHYNYQIVIQTNSLVSSFALNDVDGVAFWTDNKTIYSSPVNKSISTKIHSVLEDNIQIENLLFDWISKTLFWCEISENESKVKAFDFRYKVKLVLTRPNKILPFSTVFSEGLYIWIEKIRDPNENHILKMNTNSTNVEPFLYSGDSNCNCSNVYPFDNVLSMYMSKSGLMRLLWIGRKHRNIVVSDVNGCKCSTVFSINSTQDLTSLAVDRNYIYWTTNKSVCSVQIDELNDSPSVKNNASLSCLEYNVTAVYTINEISESIKKPCPPGFPQVKTLQSVYMIYWDPSESRVKGYSLERIIISETRNKRSLHYNTSNWTTVYSGPDNHWYMSDLTSDVVFKFRVKAENHLGWWSEYRTSDELSNTQYQVETLRNEDAPWKIFLLGVVVVCVALTMFIKYSGWDSQNAKPMRSDLELERIRAMPHRPTFLNSLNVSYRGSGLIKKQDSKDLPRIKREQITLTKQLGSGAFGEVFEGNVTDVKKEQTVTRVAIKSLKEGATQSEILEFIKEAKLMNNFKHRHILQLVGVCFDNDPNFIVMELMEGGDLLSYLRSNRPTNNFKTSLNLIDLIRMCIDVAEGCSYLEQMHFIHRDLACRNCLVSSLDPKERIIKIGDFGLARNIYTHDYYRKEGEALLPVRWMSPESLVDGVFTSQSDVWAFGVLLWEIMSLGQQPYPGLSNINVMYHVQHDGRLEKPSNCPRTLYNLMQKCWHNEPRKRPRFEFCLKMLKSFMIVPLDYANISQDSQLRNVSISSETFSIDLIKSPDVQHKPPEPISNEGYEIPVKITNNEYLELFGDTQECEYLDLSISPASQMVLIRDLALESIPEDGNLLYCNMSPEQLKD